VDCPDNSSLVPGSTTVCQCDAGFVPNPSTQTCDAIEAPADPSDPGTDTTTCVPNASPVPGLPGQCRCDAGFEPNDAGSACVPVDTGGNPPPPPPPDNGGGTGGGGNDDAQCGPNSFPLFFVCVCLPGFVVAPTADGCIAEAQSGGGGGNDPNGGCPANSHPESDGYCYCNDGFAPDPSGSFCEEDFCAANGYYGDGFFCDDFCPYADPDCF
jgi:hypothetical protein